jgi:hypothetical protein
MRAKKQDHFKQKPLIQQHVFRNNTGKCAICNATREQIDRFKVKCLKTK